MNNSVSRAATSLLLTAAILFTSAVPMSAARDEADTAPVRVASAATATQETATKKTQAFETSKRFKYSKIQSKIQEYQEVNKDVKGWLRIPNTNINEPITFSNKNNSYYVYRDWKGTNYPNTNWQNYVNTATYADYRTTFGDTWKGTSRNTVLYGHNWTNLRAPLDIGNVPKHTMFGQLPSYTSLDFAKENPYIYYSTDENEGIWKVFAVSYCELNKNFFYNNPQPSKEKYQTLLDEWQKRTMFEFDVDVNTDDRILTLSTCTRYYNMGENQRFVVVARLLREGESENDEVKVKVNKNQKPPQF